MTPIESTLRPGRWCRLRRPRREIDSHPRPASAGREDRRNRAAEVHRPPTRNAEPAPKKPAARSMTPTAPSARKADTCAAHAERRGHERTGGALTLGDRRGDIDVAGEQTALGDTSQAAQRPPRAHDGGGNAACGADGERPRRDVHRQRRGANGVSPPGPKAGHDQPGVADRAQDAHCGADERQHNCLRDEKPTDGWRVDTDGTQQANLS